MKFDDCGSTFDEIWWCGVKFWCFLMSWGQKMMKLNVFLQKMMTIWILVNTWWNYLNTYSYRINYFRNYLGTRKFFYYALVALFFYYAFWDPSRGGGVPPFSPRNNKKKKNKKMKIVSETSPQPTSNNPKFQKKTKNKIEKVENHSNTGQNQFDCDKTQSVFCPNLIFHNLVILPELNPPKIKKNKEKKTKIQNKYIYILVLWFN